MLAKTLISHAETPILGWRKIVGGKVENVAYGVARIVVHGHRVPQIERTEKTELESPQPEAWRPAWATNFLPTDSNLRPED